jgi:hypothetical protein
LEHAEAWHDFHILMGTAAATLVGLMFVAASVGTEVFTEERQVGLRAFMSPTVVAFSVVLEAALAGVSPLPTMVDAVLLGGTGVLGLFYSWRIGLKMIAGGILQNIDLEDRIWYVIVPALAYLLLAGIGLAIGWREAEAPLLLALAMALLLLAGIRNAWDMTTWIVLRRTS